MTLQGRALNGIALNGMTLQGMSLLGFQFDGATQGGLALANVHVDKGELIAERDGATLRGTQLAGAVLQAQARNLNVDPEAAALITYRITSVEPEASSYDPTHTGSTFLYMLEQWVTDSGTWQPACPADSDGRRVAIPLAATWDERGDRSASSSLFTFGCTSGVIAKCYRWGYRPWLTGYGADMAATHWTCTRLARADYCGDGVSNTHDGTLINLWDRLPAPGPIQSHGGLLPPLGMLFEAGWGTSGAVCMAHWRWLELGAVLSTLCPLKNLGNLLCNSAGDADDYAGARIFNESYPLNLKL